MLSAPGAYLAGAAQTASSASTLREGCPGCPRLLIEGVQKGTLIIEVGALGLSFATLE